MSLINPIYNMDTKPPEKVKISGGKCCEMNYCYLKCTLFWFIFPAKIEEISLYE